jgi:hypothetical protein
LYVPPVRMRSPDSGLGPRIVHDQVGTRLFGGGGFGFVDASLGLPLELYGSENEGRHDRLPVVDRRAYSIVERDHALKES